jgi:hypothetical protein
MPPPKKDDHVLLQTRAVASVGLVGVGGGIGLALVLSHVLIVLGLIITIASAIGVFWIYSHALRSVYRAITKRVPYRGPKVLELAIANVAAILLVGIGLASFSIVIAQTPPAGRATLNLSNIQRVKIPVSSSDGFINIEIKNQGSLDAEKVITLVGGLTTLIPLTAEDIKSQINAASAVFEKLDASTGAQLRAGLSALITPRAIAANDKWDGVGGVTGLTVSDAQWAEFEQGKRSIYVFYIERFEDDGHKKSYWKTTNCLFWTGTTAFWHNCADNRIDLITTN